MSTSTSGTLSAPIGDRLVLLLTFLLTVLVDLTIAIEVGLVLASFVFIYRMANTVEVASGIRLIDDNGESMEDVTQRDQLPQGVEVFQITGPLFFGRRPPVLSSGRV